MRWENLTLESDHSRADAALFGADAVVTRTFDTPSSEEAPSTRSGPGEREPGARNCAASFEWTVNRPLAANGS